MALGLGLGIDKSGKSPWLPSDESTLVAWYKNGAGITLNGSDVSTWADSSSNNNNMSQSDAGKQPAFNASTGALTFDDGAEQYLESSSDIGGASGLDDEFIVGFRTNPTKNNIVNLGHSDSTTEMIKFAPGNANTIRVKPASSTVDFDMESGHQILDDCTWIIVRKNNGEVSVYKNLPSGSTLVQQDSAKACTGDFVLNTIGRRGAVVSNYFEGTMKEIVMFKDVPDANSDALRDNLFARLKSL